MGIVHVTLVTSTGRDNAPSARRAREDHGGERRRALCLFVRSFVRLFVCSFVRLFVRLFVHSFVRSFVRSCVRSFVRSFIRSFVRSERARGGGRRVDRHVRSFVCERVRGLRRRVDRQAAQEPGAKGLGGARSVHRSTGAVVAPGLDCIAPPREREPHEWF